MFAERNAEIHQHCRIVASPFLYQAGKLAKENVGASFAAILLRIDRGLLDGQRNIAIASIRAQKLSSIKAKHAADPGAFLDGNATIVTCLKGAQGSSCMKKEEDERPPRGNDLCTRDREHAASRKDSAIVRRM